MLKKRILSGMRPTGRLHIGNLVGALENWVQLQDFYNNYHLIADWHVLTTAPESAREITTNTREMVADWLSAGLDPVKSPMFRQSRVSAHAELHLIFSMFVTLNRLLRNPTVKEQARDLGIEDLMSYGHIGYPVLQAADILLYKGDVVPVGEDQMPHIEVAREIARRFNNLYGEVFPEPEGMLTKYARLPGLDGKRMAKSLNNAILMTDPPEEVAAKLKTAFTDPQKLRRGDPGHPEMCLVFTYHQKFNQSETEQVSNDCRSGALGCVQCKKRCADCLNLYLAPLRERRAQITDSVIDDVLTDGERRACEEAAKTMAQVRAAMGI
ncbi:MAG: tryptophan--tRNA ligase [Calditrichaeota bacterium]|nr:tryptophan--tRNA ligase [Calditrichota bacterium]